MKRKLLYAALGLLCLFIITNPSATAFKEHLGKTTYAGLIRQHNFFVYSTYLDNSYDEPKDKVNEGTYVGVLGNFWRAEEEVEAMVKVDSTKAVKLTLTEFANRIKKKYPVYNGWDNKTLVAKILAKYPQYKESVDLSSN